MSTDYHRFIMKINTLLVFAFLVNICYMPVPFILLSSSVKSADITAVQSLIASTDDPVNIIPVKDLFFYKRFCKSVKDIPFIAQYLFSLCFCFND